MDSQNNNDATRRHRLSSTDAVRLAEQLAALTKSGMPLAPALRAAADESHSSALAATFRSVARLVESGTPLAEILSSDRFRWPRHWQGVIRAGIRSGRLSQVLTEMAGHHRSDRDVWRAIGMTLAYPAVLLALAGGIFALVFGLIVPMFEEILLDFDTTMPSATMVVIDFSHGIRGVVDSFRSMAEAVLFTGRGKIVLAAAIVAVATIMSSLAWTFGPAAIRARWRWFLTTVPIVGPVWHWNGVVEFTRLLRILLGQQVPLPEALSLTADSVKDANIAAVAEKLASGAAAGRPLSEMISATSRLPGSMAPVIRWGEQTDRLPEALDAVVEMFEGRIQLRATSLLPTIIAPVIFLLIGGIVGFTVIALILPLVSITVNLA